MKTLQAIIEKQDKLIRHLTHEQPNPAPPLWYVKKHKLESELSALKQQAEKEPKTFVPNPPIGSTTDFVVKTEKELPSIPNNSQIRNNSACLGCGTPLGSYCDKCQRMLES